MKNRTPMCPYKKRSDCPGVGPSKKCICLGARCTTEIATGKSTFWNGSFIILNPELIDMEQGKCVIVMYEKPRPSTGGKGG